MGSKGEEDVFEIEPESENHIVKYYLLEIDQSTCTNEEVDDWIFLEHRMNPVPFFYYLFN